VPNTLVHFALQGPASRGLWRRLDARWIYLGCLLPDVPWIIRRAVASAGLAVDPIDLRIYAMAQASLAGTLLVCAAFAAVAAAPRLAFSILGLNALLHLLIDACEIKWGNGVHLFAPLSWRMTSFELVTGEGIHVVLLSAAGALLLTWEILRPRFSTIGFDLSPRHLAAGGALLAGYVLVPLAFLGPVEASDSYSVKTLREVDRRVGKPLGLDRSAFRATADGGFLELWNGERVRAIGVVPGHDARVSLRGTFVEPHVLRIDRLVEHRRDRDGSSYLALGLLTLLWLRRAPPSVTPEYGEAAASQIGRR
jgi:hypothetical protein